MVVGGEVGLSVVFLGDGFFFGVTVGGVFLEVLTAAGFLSSSLVELVVSVEGGVVVFVGVGLMVTRSGGVGGLG